MRENAGTGRKREVGAGKLQFFSHFGKNLVNFGILHIFYQKMVRITSAIRKFW